MNKWSNRKIFRVIWFSIVTVFFGWNWLAFQSRKLPDGTFENSARVTVIDSDDLITFQANTSGENLQVIFLQGGLTDPKAYAPLCRKMAESGFTSHLIKMNWRLPQVGYKKILILFNLENGNYVVGGHSQGGKMAAQLVYDYPDLFRGLFLMGTSHPRDINLSTCSIPTLKLYGDKDGLASVPEVMENKTMLPKNSKLVLIKGGNHSQFGYLGKLLMDESPEISLNEQQEQIMANIVGYLREVQEGI